MRGFSDEERDRIREQLIETGRELLLTFGPKKTTVEDITNPVGIAKPTFYRFFDAKSDLYLVILQREMEEFLENTRSELEGVEDPREGLERLFWCYIEFGEGNSFIQQVIIQGDYQEALRDVSPSKLENVQREGLAELLPILENLRAQSNGLFAQLDSFTILGMMGGSIGLLMLHRDEYEQYEGKIEGYEEGYYEQVQKALVTTLARGLTVEE